MTALKEKLRQQIAAEGPITVATYMARCLGDQEYGYYTTREPFGRKGDFITAPEVSQMFGELIGAVCLKAYETLGAPSNFQLVELGPGRGTLMGDFLRMASHRPEFLEAATLNLVEISPRLRQVQTQILRNTQLQPNFRNTFQDVPDGPLIVIANEFFDALPIHQFVKTPNGWNERMVGLDASGRLEFGVGPAQLPTDSIPPAAMKAPEGSILETQPAANAVAEEIATRIAEYGGFALFIDYGYAQTGPGDTLQALYRHAYDDVLAHPGEADLTAHVNFETLATAARRAGAIPLPLLTQGTFLLQSGLLERAGALGAGKTPADQDTIRDVVERLAAPDEMGDLFKVLAIAPKGQVFAPFEPAS
ncbi:class I SAM-dependent methyltransferase [Roseibium alexandrii]|uniref:SAM-dependent MidA family methyltransferase n=1 Tax=Roseibium alexandrii TaxID=388408 RepID=A0A0M7AJ70_9HYPH|nr:class I SAM-dependent methyltransferase [Roseibium alexandrii]CTQ75205.1 hypothetical protein LAX5112_04145 [Roseibium alexandrii]